MTQNLLLPIIIVLWCLIGLLLFVGIREIRKLPSSPKAQIVTFRDLRKRGSHPEAKIVTLKDLRTVGSAPKARPSGLRDGNQPRAPATKSFGKRGSGATAHSEEAITKIMMETHREEDDPSRLTETRRHNHDVREKFSVPRRSKDYALGKKYEETDILMMENHDERRRA
jgi:hypothetical protein